MPNGNYRLVPVYSEMLDPITKENGEWKPINYANEIQVELASTEVRMNENNPKNDVTMEKAPSCWHLSMKIQVVWLLLALQCTTLAVKKCVVTW